MTRPASPCVSHFATCLTQIMTDHPGSSFLAATSRKHADLTPAAGLPRTWTTAKQHLEHTHSLLQFTAQKSHVDDRQSQLQDWFQLVAHCCSLQGSCDVKVAKQQQKLLTEMHSLMSGNPFFAELMQDSIRNSASEPEHQIPHTCSTFSRSAPERSYLLIAGAS